jgi:adenosylcobinamide-phosphate synthase
MQTDAATALAILGLALFIDCLLGEYPAALHPVVWLGKTISALLRVAPASGPRRQLIFGATLTLLIVTLSAGFAWLVMWSVASDAVSEIVLGGLLLKATFALRSLSQAANGVMRPLAEGDLTAARLALRSLCSRDPSELTSEEILAAVIESLAENASDSFVAPLCFHILLGVPGAAAYRAINTLDAMIGYHGKYEFLGKCAARLDDLANLIPARITALLFLATGWLVHGNITQGWHILRRDGCKTPSPNGGRPMAAMAGLLGVRLDKKGSYSLGDGTMPIAIRHVGKAWRIVVVSAIVMSGVCALGVWVRA